MTQYTLGTVDKKTATIGIKANGVEVERVALAKAASRLQQLRFEAAAPLFTAGQVASCWRRRNIGL